MTISIAVYKNAGLGFWGAPIIGAEFSEVTSFDHKTPIYSPVLSQSGGGGPLGNVFAVESRFGTSTALRCFGFDPVTHQKIGPSDFRAANGTSISIVV
jgi:hypothetical protein